MSKKNKIMATYGVLQTLETVLYPRVGDVIDSKV